MNKKTAEMQKLELIIGYFLRVGILISGTLLAMGWGLLLFSHGNQLSDFKNYDGSSLLEIIQWALFLNDKGMMYSIAGLIILISLPVLRVFLTAVLFLKQKDYRLAFMALFVFVALVFSFSLGIEV